MSTKKIADLRKKMDKTIQKRDELTEQIKKLRSQIDEEQSKEFQSVIVEQNLSFDEAIMLLKKEKNKQSETSFTNYPVSDSETINKEDNHESI